MNEYKNPVCKGSYVLGTACGSCERCMENGPAKQVKKTYSFIEAVNSGKRFRIKYAESYSQWHYSNKDGYVCQEGSSDSIRFTKHFINSEFELEEKSITITESEFDKACKNERFTVHTGGSIWNIKKDLGFLDE